MTVSRLIARPMLASIFVVGAAAALKNTSASATRAAPVIDKVVPLAKKAGIPLPENPETLVRINAGVQITAGLALATGRAPRLSAAVLAGGLIIAAGDTDGKPGVAWRTRRVAKDARREARRLAHDARRETKLARARIS
jgi:putative oxidoreductase